MKDPSFFERNFCNFIEESHNIDDLIDFFSFSDVYKQTKSTGAQTKGVEMIILLSSSLSPLG